MFMTDTCMELFNNIFTIIDLNIVKMRFTTLVYLFWYVIIDAKFCLSLIIERGRYKF